MENWFKHPKAGVGTCVNVTIDREKNRVERRFQHNLPNVSGTVSHFSEEKIEKLFLTEVFWLNHFKEESFVPQLISIDIDKQKIIQHYDGPDLLCRLHEVTQTDRRQLVKQMEAVQRHLLNAGCLKRNHAMSNMVWNGSSLKIFDFKWAVAVDFTKIQLTEPSQCPELFDELTSYSRWMSKISPSLSEILKSELLKRVKP